MPDWKNIKEGQQPIDVLLATNMISVGFDIDRLGLMLLNGQPKNTAEYIQASSRVGRGEKGTGLVFTLYNHSRSRDRSHFENFFSYHQALYRYVEPTSITPLSPQARERALPALIVGLARHVCGVSKPDKLTEAQITTIKHYLKNYLADVRSNSDLGDDDIIDEVDAIINLWCQRIDENGSDLTWGKMGGKVDEFDLVMPFAGILEVGEYPKIPLLMSMRNVDGESRGYIAESLRSF